MSSQNDLIHAALNPDYGPADITTLLGRWMDDVGIPRWDTEALRSYLLDETGASAELSTNDLLATYFSGSIDVSGFLELAGTSDSKLLFATGDFVLLAGS